MTEDRHVCVQPGQKITTMWIDIDDCVLGSRVRMDVCAIERAFRKLLQLGDCQSWPPIVGHWEAREGREDERVFKIDDGRHEYLAALAIGKDVLFVAWLSDD